MDVFRTWHSQHLLVRFPARILQEMDQIAWHHRDGADHPYRRQSFFSIPNLAASPGIRIAAAVLSFCKVLSGMGADLPHGRAHVHRHCIAKKLTRPDLPVFHHLFCMGYFYQ